MKVEIFSRSQMEKRLKEGPLPNTAVISIYDPPFRNSQEGVEPLDYGDRCAAVFQVTLHDIDIDELSEYGLTQDSYFPEAQQLAAFVKKAVEAGLDIVCQCEYGQSRSAACAAAIREYFYKDGITVFADYRYYPNQLIFNKILAALQLEKE